MSIKHYILAAVIISFASTAIAKETKLTFAKDVAPIIYSKCSSCHRAGQVGPFSLMSFEEVRKHSAEILLVLNKHQMPPWKAGPSSYPFAGDRRLSDKHTAVITQWIKSGMEPGLKIPPPPKFNDTWAMGKPDTVVIMPEMVEVPPDGPDLYRQFVIPINLTEGKHIKSMDIMPTSRAVVHHTILYLDPFGFARELRKRPDADMPGFKFPGKRIGGWAPGGSIKPFPEGYAISVPKRSDLILETHFHPTGKLEYEQTSVGLYFAHDKRKYTEPEQFVYTNDYLHIPANTIDTFVIDKTIDSSLTLFGISAHAHFICKSVKVTLTMPDKSEKILLWIPDWDFNWQEQYRFEKPVVLPAGVRMLAEFVYDNTTNNPRNPRTPPQDVDYGLQSTDEMGNIMLEVLPKKN